MRGSEKAGRNSLHESQMPELEAVWEAAEEFPVVSEDDML